MKRKGLLVAAVIALLTIALGWIALRKGNSLPGRSSRGEQVARVYCQSCHLFPEPTVLDKASWTNGALPEMARWLGLEPGELERLPNGEMVSDSDVFPHTPLIHREDWNAVLRYYAQGAPTSAEFRRQSAELRTQRGTIAGQTKQFRVKPLAYSRQTPMTLMTHIDPARRVISPESFREKPVIREGRLYVGDAMTHTLEALDPAGNRIFAVEFDSGPVSIVSSAEGQPRKPSGGEWLDVTLVGRAFPSDLMKGKLLRLRGVVVSNQSGSDQSGLQIDKLLGDLRRPVHSIAADLNGDGHEDFVVCQFGNRRGQLSWFEARDGGGFEEHVLTDRPGAIRAEVRDMNHDGRPDIVALMGQAREGVYMFLNQGAGRFTPVTLVEQHPAFGYSYFELVDFDKDGDLDLLTTNGDNGESFAPPKPYHGIRIYLNDGKNHFAERWFFPLHGAYGARAMDFDLDGDLDIAAISY
ncbi:MAG TPA: VCBS repeat-containing protein, partial [Candidatus Binatia bacterium]|nr:VCBS repeat-containing protein [Candidatus Binatia bacterium]